MQIEIIVVRKGAAVGFNGNLSSRGWSRESKSPPNSKGYCWCPWLFLELNGKTLLLKTPCTSDIGLWTIDLKLIVSSIFKHLLAICIFPFDTVCQFLFPYTDWMICLMVSIFCNSINSPDFNSLSDMHVALFRLVMVSSVVQELCDVVNSDLSIMAVVWESFPPSPCLRWYIDVFLSVSFKIFH